ACGRSTPISTARGTTRISSSCSGRCSSAAMRTASGIDRGRAMRSLPRILTTALVLLLLADVAVADDKIKVVATFPDLADMTRQVGGDLVEVQSIATGVEDIHAVPMKPSFAVALNHADVLV